MKKPFTLLSLLLVLFTSCKQNEKFPNINETTVEKPNTNSTNNEISKDESEEIYQEPKHPCPECGITITPNEYYKISNEEYQKLKSNGLNYNKVNWTMPGIFGYWYVSPNCEISFIKENNSKGPFCKDCANKYCANH